VLTASAEAIDAALSLRPIDQATTAFHLTGGLDSGSIATRAARRQPGQLNTATLVTTGLGVRPVVGRTGRAGPRLRLRKPGPGGQRGSEGPAAVQAPGRTISEKNAGQPGGCGQAGGA